MGTPQNTKIVDFAMPAPFPEAISKAPEFPGFPASKAAEMGETPQKHQNCRFCNTRSFSGGYFQGPLYFLDFLLPKPPKWGEPYKSFKIVDFAIPAPFPEAISKAPWISCFQGRRNGGNPTKAPKWSILQYLLLFRKPFPRVLGFPAFPAFVRFRPREAPVPFVV